MFYTGLDPRTMKTVFVARAPEDKAMQRALMQYRSPQNRDLVRKALLLAGREDLIGHGHGCLVPPEESRSGPRREHPGRRDNPAHDRKAIRHPDKKVASPRKERSSSRKSEGWAKAKPKRK